MFSLLAIVMNFLSDCILQGTCIASIGTLLLSLCSYVLLTCLVIYFCNYEAKKIVNVAISQSKLSKDNCYHHLSLYKHAAASKSNTTDVKIAALIYACTHYRCSL